MPFPPGYKPPQGTPKPPATLIEETEKLIRSIVRDANRRRKMPDGKYVTLPMADRVRAAAMALQFMHKRDEIPPEEKQESEFERAQHDYFDSQGKGGAADRQGASPDGAASTSGNGRLSD